MDLSTILSRKVVLSVFLAVFATLAMWGGYISEFHWQWVIMATVVSYVAGASLQNKVSFEKYTVLTSLRKWGERIKSLFTRDFIVAFATVVVTSLLLYKHRISSDVWFAVVSAIAGCYNIFNALSKREY